MMGHKGTLKNGDEWDAFTGWRNVLFNNHGRKWKRIKKRYNKRQRKLFKIEKSF